MAKTLLGEQHPLQKLRKRYITGSIVLLILGILVFAWNLLVAFGVYYLNLGYRWAFLSIDEWMYVGWTVFIVFIFIEIIFFAHYYAQAQKHKETPMVFQPQQMFKGRKLLVYTYPKGVSGGVFSKTHVKIDDETILNVRIQIIPERELWP